MTPGPHHRRGIALMIGATLCWSSAGVLVRSQGVTDAWEITFWRSLFMALFLFGVIAFFAILVTVLSLIQGRLEAKKDQRRHDLDRFNS